MWIPGWPSWCRRECSCAGDRRRRPELWGQNHPSVNCWFCCCRARKAQPGNSNNKLDEDQFWCEKVHKLGGNWEETKTCCQTRKKNGFRKNKFIKCSQKWFVISGIMRQNVPELVHKDKHKAFLLESTSCSNLSFATKSQLQKRSSEVLSEGYRPMGTHPSPLIQDSQTAAGNVQPDSGFVFALSSCCYFTALAGKTRSHSVSPFNQ